MSQRSVERLLGRLVTDEALRRRFREQPVEALHRLLEEEGLELTRVEARALSGLDPDRLDQFASALDPRLQKASLDLFPADPSEREEAT